MTRFEFAPGTVGMMVEDEDVARLDAANAVLRATIREVRDAIVMDTAITERQKQVLLDIYTSFREQNEALDEARDVDEEPATD